MNVLRKLFGKEKSEKTSESSSVDFERAKKIFFDYDCNHFYLSRDRAGDEYSKFGISKEQEQIWRDQFISLWASKLSTDDLEPLGKMSGAYAKEVLPDLIKIADQGDSYAKLMFANSIWSIKDAKEIDADLYEQARKAARDLWTSLLEDNLWISEYHKEDISKQTMKAFQAATVEEYIRNYAQSQLNITN